MCLGVFGCGSSILIKSTDQGKNLLFGNRYEIVHRGAQKLERIGNFLGPIDYEISNFYLSPAPQKNIEQLTIRTFFTFKDVLLSLIPFYSSRTVAYQGKFINHR